MAWHGLCVAEISETLGAHNGDNQMATSSLLKALYPQTLDKLCLALHNASFHSPYSHINQDANPHQSPQVVRFPSTKASQTPTQ